MIRTLIPEGIFYINNKNDETYTFSSEIKNYFGIYEYTEGKSLDPSQKISLGQISGTAEALQKFQVLLRDVKNINKEIIHRDLDEEFRSNVMDLKKVVKVLKSKRKLNSKEEIIQKVLSKKLKSISEDDINNIKFISQSSIGIIHGDLAPSNLIFNNEGSERRMVAEDFIFVGRKEKAEEGSLVENFLHKLQYKILPKKIKEVANQNSNVVVKDGILKFHCDNDRRKKYQEKWLLKIKELDKYL